MKILITNDDGYNAIGIKKLVEFAMKYGEVMVVAPKVEQSGKSHSLTLRRNFSCEKVEDIVPGVPTWVVDSTPADCVKTAHFFLKLDYDVVFSGINAGFNIGHDIIYSGTTAAATEAVLLGKKGIAFSTEYDSFKTVEERFDNILKYIFDNKLLDEWCLWNINIPDGGKDFMFTYQGGLHYLPEYKLDIDGKVKPKAKSIWDSLGTGDTDIDYIHNKYITITPLHFDRTNYEILEKFNKK